MTHDSAATPPSSGRETLKGVVIRFAGDSGDGMQLAGTLFTGTTAIAGNDLATLPDFPAEIRAPAGTLPGVSGFQISSCGKSWAKAKTGLKSSPGPKGT